jgi:hypothetical protein
MIRFTWLLLVIPVGAFVAIGLGAFDFMSVARAPGPATASSSRIEIAPTSDALTSRALMAEPSPSPPTTLVR